MSEEMNKVAADWWAERFQIDHKREAFRTAIIEVLQDNPDWSELYCDYDPQGLLLTAVRAAGESCAGLLFSAKGMLPSKTGLFRRYGEVRAKEGYGGAIMTIWPKR